MWLRHDDETQMMDRKILRETDMKNYFKNCFDESGKSYLLVAEESGKMVGFLKVNVEKLQNFFREKKALYLDDGYIIKEYRNKGIMCRLIKKAEEIARERNIKWVKGRIYTFNIPAQKMAESIGLKPLYSEYFKKLNHPK